MKKDKYVEDLFNGVRGILKNHSSGANIHWIKSLLTILVFIEGDVKKIYAKVSKDERGKIRRELFDRRNHQEAVGSDRRHKDMRVNYRRKKIKRSLFK